MFSKEEPTHYVEIRFESARLFRAQTKKEKFGDVYEGDLSKQKRKSKADTRTFKEPITYYQMCNMLYTLCGQNLVNTRRKTAFKHIPEFIDWSKECMIKYDLDVTYREGVKIGKANHDSNAKSYNVSWFKIQQAVKHQGGNFDEIRQVLNDDYGIDTKTHSFTEALIVIFGTNDISPFLNAINNNSKVENIFSTILGTAQNMSLFPKLENYNIKINQLNHTFINYKYNSKSESKYKNYTEIVDNYPNFDLKAFDDILANYDSSTNDSFDDMVKKVFSSSDIDSVMSYCKPFSYLYLMLIHKAVLLGFLNDKSEYSIVNTTIKGYTFPILKNYDALLLSRVDNVYLCEKVMGTIHRNVEVYNGNILIPINNSQRELISKNPGVTRVLDGGVGMIKRVIPIRNINTKDFTKFKDISTNTY